MLDKDDTNPFYNLYSKVGTQNVEAETKLTKYLKKLDNERHLLEINRNNEIYAEKIFAHKLKRNADKLKRINRLENKSPSIKEDTVDGNMSLMTTMNSDSWAENRDSICVSGYRLSTSDIKPRMFFWSQDASTKLPTPTAFYGHELGLNRPLTEVKLLGQDVYQGMNYRATQSADPRPVAKETMPPIRNVHTSQYPRVVERELVLERSKTDTNIQLGKETKPVVNLAKTKHFAKIYDLLDTPKKCDPEELNLNLRQPDSQEKTTAKQSKAVSKPHAVWAGDPKAIDSVRRPRRKIAEMLRNFKTREEARRCYREMLLRTPCSRNCHVPKITMNELESTYNEIPMLASEINKLKTDVERDPTIDGKQYTKSAFGVNMQTTISKKVLNKKGLPVAFRKSNSTFLKHYGGPIMEMKTPRHYNTPDIYIETI